MIFIDENPSGFDCYDSLDLETVWSLVRIFEFFRSLTQDTVLGVLFPRILEVFDLENRNYELAEFKLPWKFDDVIVRGSTWIGSIVRIEYTSFVHLESQLFSELYTFFIFKKRG